MKAMIIPEFGDTSVFCATELAMPTLKPGHVIIKVAATSINPLDCKLRQGLIPDLIPQFPAVLHGDIAGTIESVADDVKHFTKGDTVYGCIGGFLGMSGGLAEYVLADVNLIAAKPKSLTMAQASALPLVVETAWEGLIDYANLQPKQKVLIYGGTGGVGHIAIQLAKWRNATVYATASNPAKAKICQALGADYVIDYKGKSVEDYVAEHTDTAGFDVVFDTVGGKNIDTAIRAARANGQVITTEASGNHDLSGAFLKGLSLHLLFQPLRLITGHNREHFAKILTKVAELVDAKIISPLVDDKLFKVSEVAQAHQHLETQQAVGKVVVEY